MAFITMWKRGDRKCILVVSDRSYTVRLIDHVTIVREERVQSAAQAVRCAHSWEAEERRAERRLATAS